MLVPALEVFCTPEKLKDTLGSSSLLKSFGLGRGNNSSLTPINVKPIPRFIAVLAKKPASPALKTANPPPVVKANPIKATPANVLPNPPEPDEGLNELGSGLDLHQQDT